MLKGYLWICVFINAGIGVGCWIDPLGVLGPTGISVLGPNGLVELRAMYGGLEVGLALFLVWCAMDDRRFRTGVMAMTLMLAGLSLSRLVTWLVFMPEGQLHPFLIVIELGGAIIGGMLLWRTRSI